MEDHGSHYLDAAGPRAIVYCHQCNSEWYNDEHGLVCPHCEGEITEIVTTESDPRPHQNAPPIPPEISDLHNHNPWAADVSDPEEADLEEHISHGPGGSIFISQTIRSDGRPRRTRTSRTGGLGDPGDPNDIMQNFHSMLTNLMGHNVQRGQPGRSGGDDLFPAPMGFRPGGAGPGFIGGRSTYTTGRLHPRDVNEPQAPPDLHALLGTFLGGLGPPGVPGDNEARGGMPPGLQGLFASLLNPANARAGDAAYTQEALDQIISTLMEQHPTSNAPGPASPDSIAALPKKKLDEKLLGPEGTGECSVCKEDVYIGDEVAMLPCNHWFHEICVAAWLGSHNTCPICRKGIEGDGSATSPPPNTSRRASQGAGWGQPERLARRTSLGSRVSRDNGRNEARLGSIRNAGRLATTEESGSRRWQIVGDSSDGMDYNRDITRSMPGSYSSLRGRDSEMSVENQRDSRRGHTGGSDQPRDPRRSSSSTGGGSYSNTGGSGPMAWLRDRFSGGNDRQRRD